MEPATLKQAKKILKLAEDVPAEQVQKLLASGLLSDLLDANVDDMMDRMNRNEFRKLCGLVPIFPAWKTIRIGTGFKLGTGFKTSDDFCQVLNNEGFQIGDRVKNMFESSDFTAVVEETELDLVKTTAAELGFKGGAQRDQIYVRAKKLGWELCPSEVGPQLRRQYQNQPNGERVLTAMEPITVSGGDLELFDVRCSDSGLWLCSVCGDPDYFWRSDDQWVFVRPRNI